MKRVAMSSIMAGLALVLSLNWATPAQGSGVADFLFELGKKYYDHGDYRQALQEFEKALLVDPEYAQALAYIKIIEEEVDLSPEPEPEEEMVTLAEEFGREEALARALARAEAEVAVEKELLLAEVEPEVEETTIKSEISEGEAIEQAVSVEAAPEPAEVLVAAAAEQKAEGSAVPGPIEIVEAAVPVAEAAVSFSSEPEISGEETATVRTEIATVEPEISEEQAKGQALPAEAAAPEPAEVLVAAAAEQKAEGSAVPGPIEITVEVPPAPAASTAKVSFSPLDKFDHFVEEINIDIAPAKISGEYIVSLGGTESDIIWKEANGDYNEINWRRRDRDFGINTYDRRLYNRLRLNLDTENGQGFNFHGNLTIDPWSFIGKSEKVTVTSDAGDTVDVQLKYWSNNNSTINESSISRISSGVADSFSLPEMKVVDGKVAAFTAKGIEYSSGFDELDVPELEIDRRMWPIRELWVDYDNGEKFQFRLFPIAYQDQAYASDDPLQLSNHRIYWEESPWLDRWQQGILNTGGTSTSSEDFTKGEWEDDLSFFTRDSNLTRLSSLRGYSLKAKPWDNLSIESTVATPKGLWQDYDAVDNIEGANRIKFTPQDELQLGLIHTFRYGLVEGSRDAENKVIGADISYNFTPDIKVRGQIAYSENELDLTQAPYDTKDVGNAYRFELQRGKVQEERPERWDEEAYAKSEPFDWSLRLLYTHMDKGFLPALANYRLSRRDSFWGRHIHFKQPYVEYYGGLYYPSLSWYDIRPFRLGDSVDINRDVMALRLEKAFFDGDLETLLDSRSATEASGGKYIETVSRAEASWRIDDKLLFKFLGIYHDLPDTTAGFDPILYDVDTNKFFVNDEIEEGKDPSLKTVSAGFKYDFFDWLSFDFVYEYTNDFTVGMDDYPRRILDNPNFTTVTEEGLVWQESAPFLYDQYLFAKPPYPWFNIYKAGVDLKPLEDLRLRLEYTKNDYKFASQIDDNINHWGLEANYDITDNLALKFNYTFARTYNLQGRGEGLDYRRHHNLFVNLDYKMEDRGVFTLQFGEAAVLPYSTMFTTSPYSGFLPTLDTAHIVRAYFSRKF